MRRHFLISFSVLIGLTVWVFAKPADAAELFLYPDSIDIVAGQTALVEVRLDTEGESVNAAQVVVSFPPNAIHVREVLTGGSVLPLAPEQPFVGIDTVKIIGGAPSGFQGSGILARLVLEAPEVPRSDSATMVFDEEQTQVLLNDGKATPARLTVRSAQIFSVAEGGIVLTSPSHSDETQWYHNRTAIFHWEAAENAQYSYQFSRESTTVPDEVADTPVGDIKFENLEDGIYYFSLREITQGGTQNDTSGKPLVARYRVMIDGTMPESFEVIVTKQPEVYGGDFWYAVFAPQDALSGIARVEIAEVRLPDEEPQWYEAASPYVLRYQDRGAELRVRAVDAAGNAYEVAIPGEKRFPQWVFLLIGFAGLVGILFVLQGRRKRVSIGNITQGEGS